MTNVAAMYRYPVKSMLGEPLAVATVGDRGVDGDRGFAVLDASGAVGSAKHPRKWGALLRCRATLAEAGVVRVELPDGTRLRAGAPELDTRLSELLGREVAVSDVPPADGVLERAVPEYAGGVAQDGSDRSFVDATGERITSGQVAAGTFFDFARIHLITTASLDHLRAEHGGDFDPRRFRPNLVVDVGGATGAAFVEDTWQDAKLRIGTALFQVVLPTPRCVVPTLAHDELPADAGIMRAVAREHRVPVLTLGRLTCLGVYLDVLEPGVVRRGDAVVPG